MLLLGASSLSSFAGYGLAHLHKFARRYICRSCTRNIYVENYIKTRQYKTKPHMYIDLDIYFVNCGRIIILQFGHTCILYCNSDIYIVFEYINTIFRHFEPV